MSHRLVPVDQREQRPSGERAEDCLEAHLLGERGEPDQQEEGCPDPDLRRGVLKALQHARETHRVLKAGDRQPDQEHDQPEHAEQDQRPGRAGRAPTREEQREEDDRAEVGDRGRRDHKLTEAGGDVPGVLEHRNDHAKRGGDEHDRDEQRRLNEPARPQAEAEDDRDRERDAEAERGELQDPAPQALDVNFQTREEQQEGQSDEGQDRHREIGIDPAESRRPDHDAEHNLEHDRREPEAWEEPERQRGEQTYSNDDKQIGEVDIRHGW